MTKELSVPIRNHTLGDAVESHNLLEAEVGYVGGIMGGVTRNEVGHFGESVHQHHDGVLASLSAGQTRNEIQTNVMGIKSLMIK